MNNLTRRKFFEQILLIAASGTVVLGCGDQDGDESMVDPTKGTVSELPEMDQERFSCMDVSGLTEEEATQRITFQYTDQSAEQEKNCGNCVLFVEPESGTECGGCLSIQGPIHPEGYCTIWVAPPVEPINA